MVVRINDRDFRLDRRFDNLVEPFLGWCASAATALSTTAASTAAPLKGRARTRRGRATDAPYGGTNQTYDLSTRQSSMSYLPSRHLNVVAADRRSPMHFER
jgi:hypothetical protein